MKKLVALLVGLLAVIGAVVTVVFFWRKKQGSWGSMCRSAKDTTTSWDKAAAHEAGKATDKITAVADGAASTAADVADQAKGAVGDSP
jgi:hypothetical protein